MKSSGATFTKHCSVGVDWASRFLGIGLGLTLAQQATPINASAIYLDCLCGGIWFAVGSSFVDFLCSGGDFLDCKYSVG